MQRNIGSCIMETQSIDSLSAVAITSSFLAFHPHLVGRCGFRMMFADILPGFWWKHISILVWISLSAHIWVCNYTQNKQFLAVFSPMHAFLLAYTLLDFLGWRTTLQNSETCDFSFWFTHHCLKAQMRRIRLSVWTESNSSPIPSLPQWVVCSISAAHKEYKFTFKKQINACCLVQRLSWRGGGDDRWPCPPFDYPLEITPSKSGSCQTSVDNPLVQHRNESVTQTRVVYVAAVVKQQSSLQIHTECSKEMDWGARGDSGQSINISPRRSTTGYGY